MLLFLGEILPCHASSAQTAEKVWRTSGSGVAKAGEMERTFGGLGPTVEPLLLSEQPVLLFRNREAHSVHLWQRRRERESGRGKSDGVWWGSYEPKVCVLTAMSHGCWEFSRMTGQGGEREGALSRPERDRTGGGLGRFEEGWMSLVTV